MEVPLPTLAVANWFITTARANGKILTPMKLQKLIYYAHGWCLALYEKPLVDNQAEAWTYGPVFRDVYDAAKKYGSQQIKTLLDNRFLSESMFSEEYSTPEIPENSPIVPLLKRIWEVYGKLTAYQLSNMTHEIGSPWEVTMKKNPGRRNTDISEKLLKDYFKKQMPS
jgi:uncharacterized phage-associated protein